MAFHSEEREAREALDGALVELEAAMLRFAARHKSESKSKVGRSEAKSPLARPSQLGESSGNGSDFRKGTRTSGSNGVSLGQSRVPLASASANLGQSAPVSLWKRCRMRFVEFFFRR